MPPSLESNAAYDEFPDNMALVEAGNRNKLSSFNDQSNEELLTVQLNVAGRQT